MSTGVFVGLSTIDILYRVEHVPGADEKILAAGQEVLVGGPATNAAVTFCALGGSGTLVTGIGGHPLASMIRQDLEAYQVRHVDLVPQHLGLPPLSSIFVLPNGARSVISANAARMQLEAPRVMPSLLQEADLLLVDGHYLDAGIAWAREAAAYGVPVIFDGGSWKPYTDALLGWVDVAICAAGFRPPNCHTQRDTIGYLQDHGVKYVAITNGDRPVKYATSKEEGEVPTPRTTVVDTLGAGDIFHGAFCASLSEHLEFVRALREAAIIASESVQYPGTREWIRHSPHARQTVPAPTVPAPTPAPALVVHPSVSSNRPEHHEDERLALQKRQFRWTRFGIIASLTLSAASLLWTIRRDTRAAAAPRQPPPTPLPNELDRLFWRYLFPINANSADDLRTTTARLVVVDGSDDRSDPISPHKRSESGEWVFAQYKAAVGNLAEEHQVHIREATPDDAHVLIASQVVNPRAREYFGMPDKHVPIHHVTVNLGNLSYETDVRWAIYTPRDARRVRILQTREGVPVERSTDEHVISDTQRGDCKARAGTQGAYDLWLTDYLLITALPTDARQTQRVISFAGLHRTGTLAAGALFAHLPRMVLQQLHHTLDAHPYFQALVCLSVDNSRSDQGLAWPGRFLSIDVHPLQITPFSDTAPAHGIARV